MKEIFTTFVLLCSMMIPISAQTKITDADYRVYDASGESKTLAQIVETGANVEVIFLGENHDDAVAHHLQAEIFRRVAEAHAGRQVALSLEMFERDVQLVLDEYLQNLITENHFLLSSRPWDNYQTDYRPLVEFAKIRKIPVLAANAPRRYVNMVSRDGRQSLNRISGQAKTWLAPLPFGAASPEYAAKFNKLMSNAPEAGKMNLSNILDSQSLWDATMAFSIAEHLKKQPGALVIHLNGGFHSENRLGTPEHLKRYAPNAKYTVVTIKPDQNYTAFDRAKYENAGDFIILTDAKVPRSFERKPGNPK